MVIFLSGVLQQISCTSHHFRCIMGPEETNASIFCFFNFNLLFPAVFPSCNFLKEFLPSYHFCYTIFISSTTCEGESLVKLPTRCDRIRLRSALPLMILLDADSWFFFKRKAYKQIFQLKLYTFPKKMGRI